MPQNHRSANRCHNPVVIAVACESGGTGKTTTSIGIAQSCSRNGLDAGIVFAYSGFLGMQLLDQDADPLPLEGTTYLSGHAGRGYACLRPDPRDNLCWSLLSSHLYRDSMASGAEYLTSPTGSEMLLAKLRRDIASVATDVVVVDAATGIAEDHRALVWMSDVLLIATDRSRYPETDRGAIHTAEVARECTTQRGARLTADRVFRLDVRSSTFRERVLDAIEVEGIVDRLEKVETSIGIKPVTWIAEPASAIPEIPTDIPEADDRYADPLDDPCLQVAFDRLLHATLDRVGRQDLLASSDLANNDGGPAPCTTEPKYSLSARLPSSVVERHRAAALRLGVPSQELLAAVMWVAQDKPGGLEDAIARYRTGRRTPRQLRRAPITWLS